MRPYVVVGALLVLLSTAWASWAGTHPVFAAQALHLGRSHAGPLLSRLATPAGAIGLALLLLARIERSRLLLGLTALYLVVTVTTVGIGSRPSHPSPWAFLPHLLLCAGVLLGGGIALAVTQGAREPSRA